MHDDLDVHDASPSRSLRSHRVLGFSFHLASSFSRGILLGAIALGFVLFAHACTRAGSGQCESTRDCSSGELCVLSQCQRANTARDACQSDDGCGIGEHCNLTTHQCDVIEEPECTGSSCGAAADAGTNPTLVPCSNDTTCSPPSTICSLSQCTAGCASPGGIVCTGGNVCNAGTGRCDPPGGGCSGDPQCGPPSNVCENQRCIPGCSQSGGLVCGGGTVCDSSSGRCAPLQGPCGSDTACGAPQKVCEQQQCIPGCGQAGGVQCSGNAVCNPNSGRCAPGGPFCASDLDCNYPATVCNLLTGACDPGCASAGCTAPNACNTATGHCNLNQVCGTDGFEENDSSSAAVPFNGGMQQGLVVCPNDDDYYSLTLGSGDAVTIDLTFNHGEGNIDLEMLDASGTVVASARTTASNEHLSTTIPSAGTYTVRVFLAADTGPTPGNPYSLAIARNAAPCGQDSFEENDNRLVPAAIGPGTTTGINVCPSDDDFYAIPLVAGDRVTIRVSFTHAEGDIDLKLYAPGQLFSVASSASTTNQETVTYTAVDPGNYTIGVVLFGDQGAVAGNAYTMEVTVVSGPLASCSPDVLEENDTRTSASPITAGTQSALSLCPGDDDFYSIALNQGDLISATLTFTPAEGDLDLALLNSSGTLVDSSATTAGTERINYTVTAAGTYALRAFLYGDSGSTPGNTYNMDVAVTPGAVGCSADSFEPNDSRLAAAQVSMSAHPNLKACPTDDDYYAVTLAANDVLTVDAQFTHAEGDIDLVLLNAAGTVVASSYTTTNTEHYVFTAPSAGTYTVWVYLYVDSGSALGNTYQLSLSR